MASAYSVGGPLSRVTADGVRPAWALPLLAAAGAGAAADGATSGVLMPDVCSEFCDADGP